MTIYKNLYQRVILFVFLFFLAAPTLMSQNINKISLDDNWNFKPASTLSSPNRDDLGQQMSLDGYTSDLPNSMLNVLFEKKVIEDPFYRDNENKLKWLENINWTFEKKFDADTKLMSAKNLDLVLKGVDTYADVFLNDILLLKPNNLFRTWRISVNNLLKPTNNVLRIEFKSTLMKESFFNANSFVEYPAIPQNTRIFTRKAGFHYGWDWGPRFVSAALEDVHLETWDQFKLEDINFKQVSVNGDKAIIQAQVSISANVSTTADINIRFGTQTFTEKKTLQPGINNYTKEIIVFSPQLWWTHNLGTPYQYDAVVDIVAPYTGSVSSKQKIGLRSIELVQDKDAKGETFYFKLNGVPVFAKGANLIPLHFFQERVTPKFTEEIIQSAVESNMNMLRVWGGGIYQTDTFYDLCDEKGVLVWQDFMYACAMYPNDEDFLANAKEEAIEQVKRLRNHASLALWCGNNEIDEAWHNWGWQPRFTPDQKDFIWKGYENIFKKMLPEVVKGYSNNTNYHESSPRYGRYDKKSYTEGDNHDWFVWHDEKPFEHFEQHVPRFMSEYGFQSLPDWKTIGSFTQPADRSLQSPVMLLHQKHGKGNSLMRKYMDRQYKTPNSFKNFAYVSQLVQAEGIRKAIEAHRKQMPYCMGTLYWQMNDVYPVASWSSMDNTGSWKALQYYVRDAYNNMLVSPQVEKDSFKVTLVNDSCDEIDTEIIVQVMDFYGKTIFMDGKRARLKSGAPEIFYGKKLNEILLDYNPAAHFVLVTVIPYNKNRIERTFFFTSPKDLVLPTSQSMTPVFSTTEDGILITLRSTVLLKNICLSTNEIGWFDKNYFDLIPNRETNILFKTKGKLEDVKKSFEWVSLVNTF